MTLSLSSPVEAGQIVSVDHPHIEAVLFVDAPNTAGDLPVEIRVAMRNGRTLAFTAYTPAALSRAMGSASQLSVVDAALMIVMRVTPDAIIDALDQMLVIGIERFGLSI
jgi:hypothetical protein